MGNQQNQSGQDQGTQHGNNMPRPDQQQQGDTRRPGQGTPGQQGGTNQPGATPKPSPQQGDDSHRDDQRR